MAHCRFAGGRASAPAATIAQSLVDEAYRNCPHAKATRRNIDVAVTRVCAEPAAAVNRKTLFHIAYLEGAYGMCTCTQAPGLRKRLQST
jgi:hypothetical protein